MFLDSCSLKVCFACLLVPFDDMHDTDDSLCKHSAVCCGSNVKHTHCYLFCLLYPLVRQSPQRSHASERHAVRRGIPSRPVCASLAKAHACCTRPCEREGMSILWGAGRQKGCADTLICSLTLVKLLFFLFSFIQWKDAAVPPDATNMTNISWTVV